MDYSGYNIQHQHHQEAYNYDPSSYQIQPTYNQSYSYQQYYPYTPQYAYYPTDPTYQPHLQYQPELAPVHPPGVNPTNPEPAPRALAHVSTGPSHYRGRGGRSFRGGGRGRGRGGGRHFPSHSYGPAISNVGDGSAAAVATSVVQPSSSVSGKGTPKPAQAPTATLQPASRHVQCEICKVECNTPEILEQHKNGKRHKKNMKVHEDLQRRKAMNGQQSVLITSSQLNSTCQPKQVQESEKKGCATENMGSEVTAINGQQSLLIPCTELNFTAQATPVQEAEKELQNNGGQASEVPAEEPAGKTTDNSAVRGRGLKRKTKGGRGSKYVRTDDGSRRPVEPPRPEQAKSFICELCNVKCDSQVVYDSHLIGKKHLQRLKRVHGRNSRAAGLQTVYPSDITALANAINVQVQQGDSDPQVLLAQLLMSLVSKARQQAIAPTSTSVAAAQTPAVPTSVAGSSYELQLSQTQTSEITAHVENGNPAGETKNLLLSVPLQSDDLAGSINALSNSITAQIQQGVSDPQVLLANLLTTIITQAQIPAVAPPSGPVAAQIPAPTSVAESSNEPQLHQAEVSEITEHVEKENLTGKITNQLSSVPLELDALAGSNISTEIGGGSSESKVTGA
ncbi:hypothetical protein RIF29_25892 [Crotalaria pallida]|uniref:Uncharacterized protein n=1 Tax=Crotalaria pallida TaxID=3830 RepID=A0AAN9EM41_CROPI